jgi:hypothetical protein
MRTGGPDGKTVHIIGVTEPSGGDFTGSPFQGINGCMLYNRSTDGGATFDKLMVQLPGVDSTIFASFGADSYAVHSNHEDNFINFPKEEIKNEIVWTLPSKDAVSCYDMRLESYVFQISARNILSPVKLLIGLLRKRGRVSLKSRLKLSEAKADVLIFKGGQ